MRSTRWRFSLTHNLTDVAGLLIAWGAVIAARKPPSDRFSYGFGRSTILAALANSIAILVGVGAVVLESVQRFSDPVVVPAVGVLIVAAIGIVINAGTAMLFSKDRRHDLRILRTITATISATASA